jgi:hypothetical protein
MARHRAAETKTGMSRQAGTKFSRARNRDETETRYGSRFVNLVLAGVRAASVRLMTPTKEGRDEWWPPSDLFFLKHALEHGMTFAEVAGFLSRNERRINRASIVRMQL